MGTQPVLDAIDQATWTRDWAGHEDPIGLVHHTNRGLQCIARFLGHQLRKASMMGSIGLIASALDSSLMAPFFGLTRSSSSTDAFGQPAPPWPARSSSASSVLQPPCCDFDPAYRSIERQTLHAATVTATWSPRPPDPGKRLQVKPMP